MKSTIEILDEAVKEEFSKSEAYTTIVGAVRAVNRDEITEPTLIRIMHKAMKLYAQQFITAADNIICPAIDILPDTYDKDVNIWLDMVYEFKQSS